MAATTSTDSTDTTPLLRRMFDAAVAAVQPALCLPPHLPPPPKSRTIVIGAGKASAVMAQALEDHWSGPSAVALNGLPGVYALAADTDGVDGAEDIAGPVLTPNTLQRGWVLGTKPRSSLDNNDRAHFLSGVGRLGGDRAHADQRERLPRHPHRGLAPPQKGPAGPLESPHVISRARPQVPSA